MNLTSSLAACCVLFSSVCWTEAFSLRGPVVGQAVDLKEEYRWNTPVVTYGFDQSFLDYFGPQGVKAVEAAFQTLNDLPRASRVNLDDYPLDSRRINFEAAALDLYDLKSVTLALVLEQTGLAQPTAHIFDVQYGGGRGGFFPGVTVLRNFDPDTLLPSFSVNGVLYESGGVPVDPLANSRNAVADQAFQYGQYYTGLTRDDVGGLRYVLSRTNRNWERMSGISMRPPVLHGGVEKISFVERTARKQPDFLFCAGDLGDEFQEMWPLFRTVSLHWINGASSNGVPGAAGPGVIRGQIKMTFDKRGPSVWTVVDSVTKKTITQVDAQGWGTFSGSTNSPVLYPSLTNKIQEAKVRIPGRAFPDEDDVTSVPVPFGGTVVLQSSTNQVDWVTECALVNTGSTIVWHYYSGRSRFRYFRAIPGDGFTPVTPPLSLEEQTILIEAQRLMLKGGSLPPDAVLLPPTSIEPPPVIPGPL